MTVDYAPPSAIGHISKEEHDGKKFARAEVAAAEASAADIDPGRERLVQK